MDSVFDVLSDGVIPDEKTYELIEQVYCQMRQFYSEKRREWIDLGHILRDQTMDEKEKSAIAEERNLVISNMKMNMEIQSRCNDLIVDWVLEHPIPEQQPTPPEQRKRKTFGHGLADVQKLKLQ